MMVYTNAERARRFRAARRAERNAPAVTEPVTVTEAVTKPANVTPEPMPRNATMPAVVTKKVLVDCFGVEIRPRICTRCPGLTFSDLISHSDHLATHNPSPAQWSEAYKIIQAAAERKKEEAKHGRP